MAVLYGHSQLFSSIEDDFKQRLPVYHKSRRGGLYTLAALMLDDHGHRHVLGRFKRRL
ncbi:MAG: hypothetical protein GY927_18890 [bacterium]|nr:hypothetical protein [bacterium]